MDGNEKIMKKYRLLLLITKNSLKKAILIQIRQRLGLLAPLQEESYEIKSKRESGHGRYDVCLFPKNPEGLGIILEFKKAKEDEKNLQELARLALLQTEKLQHVTELKSRGIQKILALGVAFQGKNVSVEDKIVL